MQIPKCFKIVAQSIDKAIQIAIENNQKYSFLELEISQFEVLSTVDIDNLYSNCQPNLILNFANIEMTTQNQKIIIHAIKLGFDFVEISLKSALKFCTIIKNPKNKPKKKKNQLLELAKPQPTQKPIDLNLVHPKTNLIISHYNLQTTDNYRSLRKICNQIAGFGAKYQKIVCNTKNNVDLITLVRLLTSKTQNSKMVIDITGTGPDFDKQYLVKLGSQWQY
jgi:hypothetical protein